MAATPPSRSTDVEETEVMSIPVEERGDLLIRNLWNYQTDYILDVHITNLGAPSNIRRKPEAFRLFHEREKKYLSSPGLCGFMFWCAWK